MTLSRIYGRRIWLGTVTAILAGTYAGCQRPSNAPSSTAPSSETPIAGDVYCTGLIDVEGGVVQVSAIRGGIVSDASVAEGDRVHAGQVLLTLADDAEHDDLPVIISNTGYLQHPHNKFAPINNVIITRIMIL